MLVTVVILLARGTGCVSMCKAYTQSLGVKGFFKMSRRAFVIESTWVTIEFIMSRHLYIRLGKYEKIIEWSREHKLFED